MQNLMYKKGDRVVVTKIDKDLDSCAVLDEVYWIDESTGDPEDPAPYRLVEEKGVKICCHWVNDDMIELYTGEL